MRILLLGSALCAAAFVSLPAQALTYLGTFSGNDCQGAGGFGNCYAYQNGGVNQGQTGSGSPAIIKFNPNGTVADQSSAFSTITGAEFNITYVGATNTLSFTYAPSAGDPEIHYFTVKQANGYALFYDLAPITSGTIALNSYFPSNPGFSHITFFDTGSTPPVPEPATWAMMLVGFGLLGSAMRRRKQNAGVQFA